MFIFQYFLKYFFVFYIICFSLRFYNSCRYKILIQIKQQHAANVMAVAHHRDQHTRATFNTTQGALLCVKYV